MTTPRSGAVPLFDTLTAPASVLLPNGTVLVVGGTGDGTSTELYTPTTGKWSATGRAIARTDRLMLLPNGKVLGAGELYDPATGTWSQSNIPLGVLLPDGTILVDGTPPVLFDLETGHFSPTGPHVFARVGSAIEYLANGRVLVVGGCCDPIDPGASPTPELYEPSTKTWSLTAAAQPFQPSESDPVAVLMADGKVLVAGGEETLDMGSGNSQTNGAASLYDPSSSTWTNAGTLPSASSVGEFVIAPDSLTLLPDGRVLAAGEHLWVANKMNTVCEFASTASLFDEAKRNWTPTGSTLDSSGGPGHTATLLNNGTVLLAGGTHFVLEPPRSRSDRCNVVSSTVLASAEIYAPPTTNILPTSCTLTFTGTDATGHVFIRVAARDIASGLQSVRVVQATNATVALPQFPPATRDPAVVTATKINASQPSTLTLSVTNRVGKTITCDPVIAHLVDQHDGDAYQVFRNLSQAENTLRITNGTPGLTRVRVQVNSQHFRLDDLQPGEVRTLAVASAMHPGDQNTIAVTTHGPRDSSALLVISD